MWFLRALLVVAACAPIICSLHYFILAGFWPSRFVAFLTVPLPAWKWLYVLAVIVGYSIFAFHGFVGLLSFLPLPWESANYFGPTKSNASVFLTTLSLLLVGRIESFARDRVKLDKLREHTDEAKQDTSNVV